MTKKTNIKINIANVLRHFCVIAAIVTLMASAARAEPPVKIYLLVGQSNMQGKGTVEGEGSNTLRHMVENDPNKEFQSLVNDAGEWVEREDVWIHYDLHPFRGRRYGLLKPGYGGSSGQIGPELGFGHVMGDASEGQVLLIKAAWGGKSLGHNFLPPSIGKYPLPIEPSDPGYFYHRTLQLVSEVTGNIEKFFPDYHGQGMEIAGLCWHQGWNDQYGGLAEKYEQNLAAFIKDIRSEEHGLGVPKLPVVIATSGMIGKESPIKEGQRAMADTEKYPEFAGNVAVVDTEKPYGPDKMKFKFSSGGVGFHWNSHARIYFNIGRAMAAEMRKLDEPKLPSRMTAHATDKGVRLNWQLGTEKPEAIKILRNGKKLDVTLAPTETEYVDTTALPGTHQYELVLNLPASGKRQLSAACDTSVAELKGRPSLDGMMLSWEAAGNYEGFRISREGKVIADRIAGDVRSFEDTQAPTKGEVVYAIEPKRGETTPAKLRLKLGPPGPGDAGGAVVYEPFNYPASVGELQFLPPDKGGALGTRGSYVYLSDEHPERRPATLAKGVSYGALPVMGNRGSTHRWSDGAYIELDDSLREAGLLEDGATLWMSYVFVPEPQNIFPNQVGEGEVCGHRFDGSSSEVTLRSEDMQEGIGLSQGSKLANAVVYSDGKKEEVRIDRFYATNSPMLVVGKITWGEDGENDSFVPYKLVGPDLKLTKPMTNREVGPFNIDQSKLSRLVLSGEGQFDEIRVGPTFESVIGAAK